MLELDDQELAQAEMSILLEELFEECQGNSSAKLQIEHPDGTVKIVAMDRPYLTAGRSPDCDIQLDHGEISSFHSLFLWIGGALFCCDVAPRTSFFPEKFSPKNGQWVTRERIEIGPFRIKLLSNVTVAVPELSPLDRSARLAADYPYLGLQFEGVKEAENLWPVNRTLTLIGRSSQCKLRLNHRSVSTVQAGLLRTTEGCWLFDLANDGKTGVNGYSVKISQVDVGDVLQLGSFQIDVVSVGIQAKSATPTRVRPIVQPPMPQPPLIVERAASASMPTPVEMSVKTPVSIPVQTADDRRSCVVDASKAETEPRALAVTVAPTAIPEAILPVESLSIASRHVESSPEESCPIATQESNDVTLAAVIPAIQEVVAFAVAETCPIVDQESYSEILTAAEPVVEDVVAVVSLEPVPTGLQECASPQEASSEIDAVCDVLPSDDNLASIVDACPAVVQESHDEMDTAADLVVSDVAIDLEAMVPADQILISTLETGSTLESSAELDTVCENLPSNDNVVTMTDVVPIVVDEVVVDSDFDIEAWAEPVALDIVEVLDEELKPISLQESASSQKSSGEIDAVCEILSSEDQQIAVADACPVVIDDVIESDFDIDMLLAEPVAQDLVASVPAESIPVLVQESASAQESSIEIDAVCEVLQSDDSPIAIADTCPVASQEIASLADVPAAIEVMPAVSVEQPQALKDELNPPRLFGKKSDQELAAFLAPTNVDPSFPAPRRTPSGMLVPRKAQHKDFDPSKYLSESAPNPEPVVETPAVSPVLTTVHPASTIATDASVVRTGNRATNGSHSRIKESKGSGSSARRRNRGKQSQDPVAPSPISGTEARMIAEFIQNQQAQLAQLKSQLAELEQTYNDAAGSVISYRMRDSLAKPVGETLRCHDTMQESLEKLSHLIEE